jgi:hypothetical protein
VYAEVRHFVFATVFALVAAWSAPAAAWIELNPKGLLSTLDVEKDGHATVSHELTLDVRGGPLKELDLGTSDPDAEILPDATVTRLSNGLALPLLVERRADGSLRLEIDHPKGLRSGTYSFRVRYRTNLVARSLVRRRAQSVEIGWVGPRLDAGLDGARAIFRLKPTEVAPRLPTLQGDDPDPGFGVMVAAVHHTPQADEIELVRSHVAKGEPVLWRIEASADALPASPEPAADAKPQAAAPAAVPVARARSLRWPSITAAFGLALAVLAWLKAARLGAACRLARATVSPLVPLPGSVRALLAGLVLGLGLYFAGELLQPIVAAAGVLSAMALVIERAPRGERTPRGPGRWLSLRDEDAFAVRRSPRPGAYFDSGTLRGVLLLALVLGATVALAAGELGRSPYHALLMALGGATLMPLFFTGRESEASRDQVAFSQRFMRDLARALRGQRSAKVVAWGRVPDGQSEPDELRVLIQPKDGVEGLVALETGLDAQRGLGGVVGVPFVIVRAKEGSAVQRALPRGVVWSRGRKADERVAILSPKLPTLGLTVALVGRLLDAVTGAAPPKGRRSSAAKTPFGGKLGGVRSPAHAA